MENKRTTPLANGDVYGIALGFYSPRQHTLNFDSEQGVKLQSLAFSADAEIKSFACRTGTRVFEEEATDWKENESQAQVMANAIRRVVWAYVCKSNYKDTWGTFLDRRRYDLCRLPDPAVPGGSG